MSPRNAPRYILLIAALTAPPAFAAATQPAFKPVTIDSEVGIGYGLALADVDGDRRLDIVLADKNLIAWYHNPDWAKHLIAERLTELDHVCIAAADIDGDGKAELAAGAGWNPGDTFTSGALFYLLAPADRTQRWEPIRLAHDPTVHRIRWARDSKGRFDLLSLPLHGRGNKNGLGDGVRFLAYHPPADPKAAWTTSEINHDWHATHNFEVLRPSQPTAAADEVLVAGKEGVFWLKPRAEGWQIIPIATNGPAMPDFVGAGEVRAGRSSGRIAFVAAIEPMHGNQLVVYASPPSTAAGDGGSWKRTVIDATLVDGHALACGDFVGQGRDQIVAGWRAMNRPGTRVGIRYYSANDDSGTQWTSSPVDDNEMACEDLQVGDLDGDGDLDIVAAGRATKNLRIYLNQARQP